MGSAQGYWAFGREPWTAPKLEDLLPDLSLEERLRLQNQLRQRERAQKRYSKDSDPFPTQHSEGQRDYFIIPHVRYALHHYNAKHPGEEFDAVKPLMVSSVGFRGQAWYHINFWARCRKSKKIKRFFAELHYKTMSSSSVCSDLLFPVPGSEKTPSSSSVCPDLPFPIPETEKPASSSSVCSRLPFPAPEADKPPCSSSGLPLRAPVLVPIVEVCTIIEEPLDRYMKSCAFCRGYLDILHPKGRKFVCGNDKDRITQRLSTMQTRHLEMPFTCNWPLPTKEKS
ncbi:hypothetical protein U9M48_029696 [Paspalum notatum var. saurae]|uniref:DUF3615 domain-containing protein n=1 Tax=Paspalum notatum var. saurae TaxID=547442 RepID=A0AAQ3U237_PASNO